MFNDVKVCYLSCLEFASSNKIGYITVRPCNARGFAFYMGWKSVTLAKLALAICLQLAVLQFTSIVCERQLHLTSEYFIYLFTLILCHYWSCLFYLLFPVVVVGSFRGGVCEWTGKLKSCSICFVFNASRWHYTQTNSDNSIISSKCNINLLLCLWKCTTANRINH